MAELNSLTEEQQVQCCMPASSDLAPFCMPIGSTCCGDTFCVAGESCCGGFCCPAVRTSFFLPSFLPSYLPPSSPPPSPPKFPSPSSHSTNLLNRESIKSDKENPEHNLQPQPLNLRLLPPRRPLLRPRHLLRPRLAQLLLFLLLLLPIATAAAMLSALPALLSRFAAQWVRLLRQLHAHIVDFNDTGHDCRGHRGRIRLCSSFFFGFGFCTQGHGDHG